MNSHDYNEPERAPQSAGGAEDDLSMPLGVGGFESVEESDSFSAIDAESTGRPRINSGALVLAAVVICAVSGLFAMRTLTRASAAFSAPTEVEKSIESFLTVVTGNREGERQSFGRPLGEDERAVLEILNESYALRQVPLDHVQRNPFIIFGDEMRTDQTATPTGTRPDPMELKRKETRTLFEQAAGRLSLRSILMGANPLANINNAIVQVGDSVMVEPEGVPFRVEQITNDAVRLVAEDQKLDVTVTVQIFIKRNR